ncbi:N-acetylglucosamine kinase [Fodinicola feengrottensis]|uniref:BadF/BadG/BcrA/BcrD ATPase family protein n=1 Tax=Fodinicola feengrottensis TaxID=435914 RepID=A0ABN2HEQ5_9ACTN|nr:BadF/BadG/BcrA/BcrD ATPase family protein [Fodinicola feengrottensis]
MALGLDAGGTSTRCVIATLDGTVVGRGRGPGASTQSSADPAGALSESIIAALAAAQLPAASVVAALVGMAGAGSGRRPIALAALTDAAERVGLPRTPDLVTDLETAYAAGTAAERGLLVIAGTGAITAWLEDGVVRHRADGYGWLLGDAGSAVWQGRRAVKAVLAALDGRGLATELTEPVISALTGTPPDPALGPDEQAQRIVAAVYAATPADLGKAAPAVRDLAGSDPVATEICREAAYALIESATAVLRRADDPPSAIVLGGSVLTNPGPVADAVRTGLADRTGVKPTLVTDAALGAVALALRSIDQLDSDTYARLIAD